MVLEHGCPFAVQPGTPKAWQCNVEQSLAKYACDSAATMLRVNRLLSKHIWCSLSEVLYGTVTLSFP